MTNQMKLQEKEQAIKRLELYRELGQTELLQRYYDETIEKFKEWHWYESAESVRLQFENDMNSMSAADDTTESRISDFKKNHKLNIRK